MVFMSDSQAPSPRAHQSACHHGRIGPDKLLSAEQERELADRAALGDDEARNRLVRCNLGLVFKIARGYLGRGLVMEDLAGEGNLGLIRAAGTYRPGFGARFSTHAGYWIKQAIRDSLSSRTAMIRLPNHMVSLLSKWRRAERTLARGTGQPQAFDQIAATLGLTDSQREMARRALHSRHVRRADGEGEVMVDGSCGPEEETGRSDEADSLRARMVERLDPREREIIALRFGLADGEPRSLKEVGRVVGFSREWVSKVERRAIGKLRDEGPAGDRGPGRSA